MPFAERMNLRNINSYEPGDLSDSSQEPDREFHITP